ncbi:MAG: SDR family oxidoreductase [Pseudomonadales bacterium]|jgi:meso-butanediol dehydrogenase/(S,S)-butanediol dehydrogenase/diacetyl reductase|nr:SDR family oxidoreductase [Pseudomonadales bacterium]MCP5320416.1 SDR family oxidoreductase [Pseudomonadales bacterium]MCP5336826.1 SDR family oxidoreductase [Pseudomonadales bacterium]
MKNRFDRKVALITGAASGMGRATALRMGSEGARVYCVDLNGAGAEETAAAIRTAGGEARSAAADVADPARCRALVAEAVAAFGGLDILCNIAGFGGLKAFTDETAEGWQKMFSVNVHGPFYLSQAALPHLLASKGNIVNVASTAGLIGQAYMATYTASKHALVGLTKSMALEFGRKGLRVNAVCPGGTTTPFLQAFAIPPNAEMDLIGRVQLLPDYAAPEDIAHMICFTASDEAKFVNGALLSVDGGTVAG